MTKGEMLAEVYQSQKKILLWLCQNIVGGTGPAEDIVHSVFLKVLTNAATFENSQYCFRYLRRACNNAAIDVLRKHKRRTRAHEMIRDELQRAAAVSDDLEIYESEQQAQAIWALVFPLLEKVCREKNVPVDLFLEMQRGSIIRYAKHHGIPVGTMRSRCLSILRELRTEVIRQMKAKGLEMDFNGGKT